MNTTKQRKSIILVVEDEMPLLRAVQAKLERSDFDVVTARTVEQALEYLDDEDVQIDAVWLDHYLLGKQSGIELVAKCKEEGSRSANIPIFLISNTASRDKVQTYLKLGVNNYYVKAQVRLDAIISDIKKELGLEK
jgi:DNA-binding response OmpR family regulator